MAYRINNIEKVFPPEYNFICTKDMNLNEHERFPTSYIDTNQGKDTAI